jgi:hypothetical protein
MLMPGPVEGALSLLGALFNAILCRQRVAEPGQGTLERARGVNRWCQ